MATTRLLRNLTRAPLVLSAITGLLCLTSPCLGGSLFTKSPEPFFLKTAKKPETSSNPEKLFPNRVYRVFLSVDPTPRFALTDDHGNFEEPFRIIRKRTVLPAKCLGISTNDRYVLRPEGIWKKTDWPLVRTFELFEKPARLQIVFWKTATESQVRSVSSTAKIRPRPVYKICSIKTNDCSVEAKEPLLPSRLYYVSFEEGRWEHMVTDRYGKFQLPPEVLQEGSIIPGPWIGNIFQYSRYQILSDGHWKQTPDGPERQVYQVVTHPALIKYVNYDYNLGTR